MRGNEEPYDEKEYSEISTRLKLDDKANTIGQLLLKIHEHLSTGSLQHRARIEMSSIATA